MPPGASHAAPLGFVRSLARSFTWTRTRPWASGSPPSAASLSARGGSSGSGSSSSDAAFCAWAPRRRSLHRPSSLAAFSSGPPRASSSFVAPSPSPIRNMATSTSVPTPANGSTDAANAPGAIDPAENNSSGVTADALREKLRTTLNAAHVDVQDISGGCGQSFAATIVSDKFEGKMALARHRLVNASVKDEVNKIHAWTPKCFTPAEWEKKNGEGQS